MGMSKGGKRCEKRSRRPGRQPPNQPRSWDRARTCGARAGRGDTRLGATRTGLGGKERDTCHSSPGEPSPQEAASERGQRWHASGGLSPAGTADLPGNLGSAEGWLLALGEEYVDPAAGPE